MLGIGGFSGGTSIGYAATNAACGGGASYFHDGDNAVPDDSILHGVDGSGGRSSRMGVGGSASDGGESYMEIWC